MLMSPSLIGKISFGALSNLQRATRLGASVNDSSVCMRIEPDVHSYTCLGAHANTYIKYVTSYHNTSHHNTSNRITTQYRLCHVGWHYITLPHMTSCYMTTHCSTVYFATIHCTARHGSMLHVMALYCIKTEHVAVHQITSQCRIEQLSALHQIKSHSMALHYIKARRLEVLKYTMADCITRLNLTTPCQVELRWVYVCCVSKRYITSHKFTYMTWHGMA